MGRDVLAWSGRLDRHYRAGPGATATTLPFVPGDSILEAFRLATAAGIPVAFVDGNVVTSAGERAERADQLPGAELAGRTGLEYVALAEALMAQRPAGPSALAREAVMARHLAGLMEDYASVLWVGGLAHWSRIEARLRSADFSTPAVPSAPPLKWRRGRLAPSALHHMTGQSPWKVRRFAASPRTFESAGARPPHAPRGGAGRHRRSRLGAGAV